MIRDCRLLPRKIFHSGMQVVTFHFWEIMGFGFDRICLKNLR